MWDFGNEFEVTAGLVSNCALTQGLEANGDPATQYQKVIQDFNMIAFLNKEIDAAEAMIYNEYAQVLETVNPETGELYKPEDLNIFSWNDYRSSMLQDAIFAARRGSRTATTGTSRFASSGPRSRAGCTAATTLPTASQYALAPAASSAPVTRPGR